MQHANPRLHEQKSRIALTNHLRETEVGHRRSASVEKGSKACFNHDDQRSPAVTSGNYTVHGGEGLVLFDIDVPIDDLPGWVQSLPPTLVVKSPHGGYHLYYVTDDDTGISNRDGVPWGSIRYSGEYLVGPGSVIDHSQCEDGSKENCPGEGTGKYKIAVNKPIAMLSDDHLEPLREACDSGNSVTASKENYGRDRIELPNDAAAEEGERYICMEFTQRENTSSLACREVMDFLRGGTGTYDLQRDNNSEKIDQSAADYYALEMVYGAFRFRGDETDEARHFTLSVFKRYCRENPYDKTGDLRKWLRKGESYIQEQMDAVEQDFDFGNWHRWRRREYDGGFESNDHVPWANPEKDGTPSAIAKDTVYATILTMTTELSPKSVAQIYGLDLAIPPTSCGEMFTPQRGSTSPDSRHYPTAREVGEIAAQLNPDRKASYFEEVLKKESRETSKVTHAYCPTRKNGERHVYFPSVKDTPEDARWVKTNGERYELESTNEEN